MDSYNKKKSDQLGMPGGTAAARLRKKLLFHLVRKYNLNTCYQCNCEIKTEEELSIEHKIPWLDSDNPVDLFFDINNIAFSHLKCNIGAGRKMSKQPINHGTESAYKSGCRCEQCTEAQKLYQRKFRAKQNWEMQERTLLTRNHLR